MLCEKCGQREASVKITKITDGNVEEYHLCENCMKAFRAGEDLKAAEWSQAIFKLLADAVVRRMGEQNGSEENERLRAVSCPSCGKTYGEFLDDHTFGCSDCYEAFGPYIQKTLLGIQGADQHTGRKSARKVRVPEKKAEEEQLTTEEEISVLTEQMQDAVSMEDYEKAAALRDRIRVLREQKT